MGNGVKLLIGIVLMIVGSAFAIFSAFNLETGGIGWAVTLAVSVLAVVYGIALIEHVRSEEGW